jgi:glycosyltransferase involved in cell wall biosynthesis
MAEWGAPSRGPRSYDVVFYMPWMGPLLAPGVSLPPGGAETQIFLVAKALARHGVRVCLVAFDTPEGLPERIGDIDVIARPIYDARQPWRGKIREAISIGRSLSGLDARVIVTRASGPQVGILGLFARLHRQRFVYSSAHVVDFTLEYEPLRRNRLLFRLGIRLADTIVVQTEEQVPLCRQAFGREPVVIRSIAERVAVRERLPGSFLWIARVIWYKQPLKFLELARRLPDAAFRLVGVPNPTQDELLAEVRSEAARLPNVEIVAPRPRRGRRERI